MITAIQNLVEIFCDKPVWTDNRVKKRQMLWQLYEFEIIEFRSEQTEPGKSDLVREMLSHTP